VTISSSLSLTDVSGDEPYVWQLDQLAPGESGVITISGVLSDPLPYGLITNTTTIRSLAAESDYDNNSAAASINVPNTPPIANDDATTTLEDTAVLLDPIENDIDGDELSVAGFSTPAHGTAVLSGTRHIVYTPTLNYTGQDSFHLHRHGQPEQRQRPDHDYHHERK
jgi:hypothetical protein